MTPQVKLWVKVLVKSWVKVVVKSWVLSPCPWVNRVNLRFLLTSSFAAWISAIGFSSTARDMSICFYRLAYMEWKLGRPDLSVACYQRSIELHPEVAPNARSEMSDLIETSENLRPYPADEVMKVLDEGGLPTGSLDALREQTRDALVACADEEVFNVARPLASVMLELGRDDALLDVRRSLMRP